MKDGRDGDGALTARYVPVLIFAERTATLKVLKDQLRKKLPNARVEVIYGGTARKQRGALVEAFQSTDRRSAVHVLLVSKVAEMGLDIDGPPNSRNIWLIHHDFPWNPAMVDQRNGRVTRGATGDRRVAYITYPFIKDTVDERIFKRMLARQAIAELLLGTDDVARALRLTDQSNLDDIDIGCTYWRKNFRNLTPDLSPPSGESASSLRIVEASGKASRQRIVAKTAAAEPEAAASDRSVRPSWCPLELLDLEAAQASTRMSKSLRNRVHAMAEALGVQSWANPKAEFLRIDLVGRFQTVAVIQQDDRVVCLSLADTVIDDGRIMEAFALNAEPGVAGLLLLVDSGGEERLVARAANLTETLDDHELRRLLLETGRRADEWEIRYYGEDQDQW